MNRSNHNPIISRHDIPAVFPDLVDVSSVFNPGAIRHQGKYHLLLRVQNRGRETFLWPAVSDDGISFDIAEGPVRMSGVDTLPEKIYHIYDPRLTEFDGIIYALCAMDTDRGCVLGLARSEDLRSFHMLGIVSDNDVRNGVLFPEKVDGRYLRLERPNLVALEGGSSSGEEIWLAESDDLLHWRRVGPVMSGRPHYWDELIGSGPPPVRTERGWLHIYHGVATHFASANIYQAGVVLLDLQDPQKVVARGRYNILEPREPYELTGQVPNVVFPSGMIVDHYDAAGFALSESRVLVYYGAADTAVALALTTVQELLDACCQGGE